MSWQVAAAGGRDGIAEGKRIRRGERYGVMSTKVVVSAIGGTYSVGGLRPFGWYVCFMFY